MAADTKGKQVIWGVSAGAIAGAHSVTTSGIIQLFEISRGGGTTTVEDEDDDTVTRIDHKAENKLSLEVVCVSTTLLPEKGDEIAGASLGTIDGVNFTTGRTIVDDAKVVYSQGAVKKISVSATHYPVMTADA